MIDSLLQIIAPHHCYGCDETGPLLCNNCKYDIVSETFVGCIACRTLAATDGVCLACRHRLPYSKAWAVGERSDVPRQLLDDYKFERRIAAAKLCAELLDSILPVVPNETVVTYIPTSARHVRQRGYDHAQLIAKRFAKQRGLAYRATLLRNDHSVQHGSSRAQRIRQADVAYTLKPIEEDVSYLMIDDIFTTGATVASASRLLVDAGAKEVWLGIIARQPLDARGKV